MHFHTTAGQDVQGGSKVSGGVGRAEAMEWAEVDRDPFRDNKKLQFLLKTI